MLAKANRLAKKKDFQRVYKDGKKAASPIFILRYLPNKYQQSRFGIVISNKVSKSAPVRNKLKRQITEIIRPLLSQIPAQHDYVIVSLPRATKEDFSRIAQEIGRLFKKMKV
ncbi:MAG: ribonuclease P protein component [Patescibacteria group bacterium]